MISESIWRTFRCPSCSQPLVREADGASCGCGRHLTDDNGALDLRPKSGVEREVTFRLGKELEVPTDLRFEPLRMNPRPEVDFAGTSVPHHLTAEMLSWLPRAKGDASQLLDLGCGDGLHRPVCERAGFEWVGIDYLSVGAPILADAHVLPFADESFEAILTIAVLEHIQYPFVMLEEAFRVLAPGGRMIGTVAFLEPHHQGSFYHHSHLAVLNGLHHAGFDVEVIAPTKDWPVLRAQAQMKLFPSMPKRMAWAILQPVQLLHRLWWKLGRRLNPKATETVRVRDTTGSFVFVASRP